jgi:hypothetical protein
VGVHGAAGGRPVGVEGLGASISIARQRARGGGGSPGETAIFLQGRTAAGLGFDVRGR